MTTQNSAMDDEELRIYKLLKHQLRLARSTDQSITELAKPLRAELEHTLESRDQQIALAAEQRAARKIQALINAHKSLNPSSEVLDLVETSLPILNLLEAEADFKQAQNKEK